MSVLKEPWLSSPAPNFPGRREVFLEDLSKLIPLIDWHFFDLAWQIKSRSEESVKWQKEAKSELNYLLSLKILRAGGVIAFFPVRRFGDSLNVYETVESISEKPLAKLHFLRMQEELDGNAFCSVADFFNPKSVDWIGMFALSASLDLEKAIEKADGDMYRILLWKTLAARLTEAYSEYMHREVQKKWWGYALGEAFGVRPVPGYPTTPDHSEIETLWHLLMPESVGITMTSGKMMVPEASVCGYYIAHPLSHYFNIRRIGEDQLKDYASRKGWSEKKAREELGRLL